MSKISMCMNVLMLDEKRVVVDRSQVSLIQSFKAWGFEPVAIPFWSYGAGVDEKGRPLYELTEAGRASHARDKGRLH